jgi:hypothetical protein
VRPNLSTLKPSGIGTILPQPLNVTGIEYPSSTQSYDNYYSQKKGNVLAGEEEEEEE